MSAACTSPDCQVKALPLKSRELVTPASVAGEHVTGLGMEHAPSMTERRSANALSLYWPSPLTAMNDTSDCAMPRSVRRPGWCVLKAEPQATQSEQRMPCALRSFVDDGRLDSATDA